MRVSVAGGVEPEACHVLSVPGGVEQAANDIFIGLFRLVREELVDLFDRWRQAGQVEGHSADQGFPGGHLLGGQPSAGQRGVDEIVDRIVHPPAFDRGGDLLWFGRLEGPVSRPLRAAIDPLPNQLDLFL